MVQFGLNVTVPKTLWDEKAVMREMKKTLRTVTGTKIQKDFKSTVRYWDKKPRFTKRFIEQSNYMKVQVYPTGSNADQYYYVHEGTAPRMIFPKTSGGYLGFKPGYSAGTKKGSIVSNRARRTGKFIYPKYVRHPGIKPRRFSDTISKRQRIPFAVDMNKAIYRGLTD